MSPLDALTRILILSRGLDTTFAATPDAKLPQVGIGQVVNAKVQEALGGGNFRVSIENQPLQMNLPQGTRPGDSLAMVLVSREPRLTFRMDLPQQTPPSSLSQTGRMISLLLPDTSRPNPPVTQGNPVLPSAPIDAKVLAQSLKDAISGSGLFYESHLAQWTSGNRPLESIRAEPQNRLQTAFSPVAAATSPEAPVTAATSAGAPLAVQPSVSGPAEKTTTEIAPSSVPDSEKSSSLSSGGQIAIHHDALPIVRQQLETMETHQFFWSGQVWPGQDMQWQVKEDGEGPGASSATPDRWQSMIRIRLPALGEVEANLSLAGQGVRITMKVDSESTAERLKTGNRRFQESLDANGIPLLSMTVKRNG